MAIGPSWWRPLWVFETSDMHNHLSCPSHGFPRASFWMEIISFCDRVIHTTKTSQWLDSVSITSFSLFSLCQYYLHFVDHRFAILWNHLCWPESWFFSLQGQMNISSMLMWLPPYKFTKQSGVWLESSMESKSRQDVASFSLSPSTAMSLDVLFSRHTNGNLYATGNATVALTVRDQKGQLLPGEIRKTIAYVRDFLKWSPQVPFGSFLPWFLQLNGLVPFEYTMQEISEIWGDVTGMELHFKGWIYDWYFLDTQSGTAVTKVLSDGVRLKFLGRKLRTFKPNTPVTIYVSGTADLHECTRCHERVIRLEICVLFLLVVNSHKLWGEFSNPCQGTWMIQSENPYLLVFGWFSLNNRMLHYHSTIIILLNNPLTGWRHLAWLIFSSTQLKHHFVNLTPCFHAFQSL